MAADQVEIQLPKTQVNEESTLAATAYFRTRSTKTASTPTTIHYRLDCLKTKQVITDWTSVSPAANVTITLSPTENQILADSSKLETKELKIMADQGLSTQVIGRTTYKVRNLQGIT